MLFFPLFAIRYFAIGIEFETYYPQSPQRPLWVQKRCEEISRLRPKRLPIPEIQAYDIFKKYFGSRKAMKINSVSVLLMSFALSIKLELFLYNLYLQFYGFPLENECLGPAE